jgi:hypothetical protein
MMSRLQIEFLRKKGMKAIKVNSKPTVKEAQEA